MTTASISEPLDLTRTTPPMPKTIGRDLERAFNDLAKSEDYSLLLRQHRSGGFDTDRVAGASWLSPRFKRAIHPSRVIVTNGAQNALFLTLTRAVGHGGLLLTEPLTYHNIIKHAKVLGIRVATVLADGIGALPEAFEAACKREQPRALFLMPTLQNPTAGIMPIERRRELIDIARRNSVMIVEDDVYGMLPRDAPPPIAALAPELTWYASGLAKTIATGLRVGYIVAPTEEEATALAAPFKLMSTWFVSPLSAVIAERWINDGTAVGILDAIRDETTIRQGIVARILKGADYQTHPQAIHIWLRLPNHWTKRAYVAAAKSAGVIIYPSDNFSVSLDAAPEAVRLCIGRPVHRETVERAFSILAELLFDKRSASNKRFAS